MNAKPINYLTNPFSSILQKSEYEWIARNIMKILYRTGNTFRELSWEEYEKERKKDTGFSKEEKKYFNVVNKYCISSEKANEFCKDWYKDKQYYEKRLENINYEIIRLSKQLTDLKESKDLVLEILNNFN